jgi:hypothetical protein
VFLDNHAKDKTCGAVYIFTINSRYDIDGWVPYNHARWINHSCDPNCETLIDGEKVWIRAVRDIKKGEERVYNYGYDLDNFEDHVCKCGSKNCVGYIVDEEAWPKLKRRLKYRGRTWFSKFWGVPPEKLHPDVEYDFY